MPLLIWSRPALSDVQRWYRFLASSNLEAARRALGALRKGVKALAHQPGIGRPVDNMPDQFREWIIDFGDSGYVVRYHLNSEAVTILAVRHQKEVGF
jgi:plasmid stabilization system protein ParE